MTAFAVLLPVLLWWFGPALGAEVAAGGVFPTRLLPYSEAAALYVPALLGPPAVAYDAMGAGEPASPLEKDVEVELLGRRAGELGAPPALRRFGRLAMAGYRRGRLQAAETRFLAEHVGLVAVPQVLGFFTTSDGDPADIAALARDVLQAPLKDPETRAVAVTLEQLTDGVEGWAGIVTVLRSAVDATSIPRVVDVNATVHLAGSLRGEGRLTGFYLARPGGEVLAVPIPAGGTVDLPIPLPSEPGVYRAALDRSRKEGFPDSPWFFSFYVGVGVPEAFLPPPVSEARDTGTVDEIEDRFVEAVNRLRASYGRPALVRVGDPLRLRNALATLPRDEVAAWRALGSVLGEDPLPTEVHGLWGGGIGTGWNVEDAAWMATEHPMVRRMLLDPEPSRIVVGARLPAGDTEPVRLLYEVVRPAPVGPDVRTRARVLLGRSWPVPELPAPAPRLEAVLDEVAATVASGDATNQQAMDRLTARIRKENLALGRYRMAVYVVAPGKEPPVDQFIPYPTSRFLAVGQAAGTLGRGSVSTVVLVVVAADQAF